MEAVAFALLLLPGWEENVKRLSEEVFASGELRDTCEESRWNLGIVREMARLHRRPSEI